MNQQKAKVLLALAFLANLVAFFTGPPNQATWIMLNLAIGLVFLGYLAYEHNRFRRNFVIHFGRWQVPEQVALARVEELGRKVGEKRICRGKLLEQLRRLSQEKSSEPYATIQNLADEKERELRDSRADWDRARSLFRRRFPKSKNRAPHWRHQEPYQSWSATQH